MKNGATSPHTFRWKCCQFFIKQACLQALSALHLFLILSNIMKLWNDLATLYGESGKETKQIKKRCQNIVCKQMQEQEITFSLSSLWAWYYNMPTFNSPAKITLCLTVFSRLVPDLAGPDTVFGERIIIDKMVADLICMTGLVNHPQN